MGLFQELIGYRFVKQARTDFTGRDDRTDSTVYCPSIALTTGLNPGHTVLRGLYTYKTRIEIEIALVRLV